MAAVAVTNSVVPAFCRNVEDGRGHSEHVDCTCLFGTPLTVTVVPSGLGIGHTAATIYLILLYLFYSSDEVIVFFQSRDYHHLISIPVACSYSHSL
jgi:hypothetical protein